MFRSLKSVFFYLKSTTSSQGPLFKPWERGGRFFRARNRVPSGCLRGHPQSQRGFLKTLDQNEVEFKRSFAFSRRGIGQLLSPKSYLWWFPNTIKLNTLLSTCIMSWYISLRRRKTKRWYRFSSCSRLRCAQAIWPYRIELPIVQFSSHVHFLTEVIVLQSLGA